MPRAPNPDDRIFYVYEHHRPDKDVCFYVGKGHANRANDMRASRSDHHKSIQAKLERLGMCVEVRLVADCLTEPEALAFEIERIAFWRSSDECALINLTRGGDGVVGRKHTDAFKEAARLRWLGRKHSEESKEKMRQASLRQTVSPETRAKLSAAHKGRVWPKEIIARRSLAQTGVKRNSKPWTAERRAAFEAKRPPKAHITSSGRKSYYKAVKHKTPEELSVIMTAAKVRYWEKRKADPNHKKRMAEQMAKTWETRRRKAMSEVE